MSMMLEGAGTVRTAGTVVGGTTTEVGGAVVATVVGTVVGIVVEEAVVVGWATMLVDAILNGGLVAEEDFVLVALEQPVAATTSAMVAASSHLDTGRLMSHVPPRSEPPTPSVPGPPVRYLPQP
jgi:hypothetical protein